MTTRQYSSRSQQSTLTGAITSGAVTMTVVSGTGLLGGVTIPAGRTYTLVIDVDTALEEIVDATAVSTNTFTITRAIDGSTAQEHSAGAVVRHMAIGRDFRDANLHAEAAASYNDGDGNAHTMHGIGSGEGDVVGTDKTQTLTNKTLTAPTISNPTITGTSGVETSIVFEGSTPDDYETTLTVVDPTQDNVITLPDTTGTVVIATATQTLTNKTLTSPTISGSPVITGLSSAGMSASSATPKDYVDAILGSATSAATSAASAATSATSAATSATSASNSATASATSASAAATSATSAATSATSAETSATAAATSATSALLLLLLQHQQPHPLPLLLTQQLLRLHQPAQQQPAPQALLLVLLLQQLLLHLLLLAQPPQRQVQLVLLFLQQVLLLLLQHPLMLREIYW
jgi:hypothetical protein